MVSPCTTWAACALPPAPRSFSPCRDGALATRCPAAATMGR
jgi:hypothetical protein